MLRFMWRSKRTRPEPEAVELSIPKSILTTPPPSNCSRCSGPCSNQDLFPYEIPAFGFSTSTKGFEAGLAAAWQRSGATAKRRFSTAFSEVDADESYVASDDPLPASMTNFSTDSVSVIRKRLKVLRRRCIRRTSSAIESAVLIPLCTVGPERTPAVILNLRSTSLGNHSGQVCFPGGRTNASDASFTETALRECEEELGIARKHVTVLGQFHDVAAHTTADVVTPVIAFVGDYGQLKMRVNRNEVQSVFAVPLKDFCDPKNRTLARYDRPGSDVKRSLPVFRVEASPVPIWGMTAVMLEELLREVLTL